MIFAIPLVCLKAMTENLAFVFRMKGEEQEPMWLDIPGAISAFLSGANLSIY